MINGIVKKLFNFAGLQIQKINSDSDIETYIKLYGKEPVQQKRFYNVGAGSFFHPSWTNVDYTPGTNGVHNEATVINFDLFSLHPLPLADESAQLVYTSHTIEHLNNAAVQNLFIEAFRMLRKNGIFRIAVPDVDLVYRAYCENDRDFFYWIDWYSNPERYKALKITMPPNEASLAQLFLQEVSSYASLLHENGKEKITDEELERIFKEMSFEDALDYCISKTPPELERDNLTVHINWFNQNKVFKMLRQAGFKNIYRSSYGQSFAPVMRNLNFFDGTMPKVSLYMEAKK